MNLKKCSVYQVDVFIIFKVMRRMPFKMLPLESVRCDENTFHYKEFSMGEGGK